MTESNTIRGRDDDTPEATTAWQTVAQHPYERERPVELTTVIVEAVADVEGVAPTEVSSPPLYEVVDVPAIEDGFFGRKVADDRRDSTGSVDFRYRGVRVTVTSDGWVTIDEPSDATAP